MPFHWLSIATCLNPCVSNSFWQRHKYDMLTSCFIWGELDELRPCSVSVVIGSRLFVCTKWPISLVFINNLDLIVFEREDFPKTLYIYKHTCDTRMMSLIQSYVFLFCRPDLLLGCSVLDLGWRSVAINFLPFVTFCLDIQTVFAQKEINPVLKAN